MYNHGMVERKKRNAWNDLRERLNNRKVAKIISIVAAILVGFVVISFVATIGDRYYSADFSTEKAKMQKVLDDLGDSHGKLIASKLVDEGCDAKSSVGLARRIDCHLNGYYFSIVKKVDAVRVLQSVDDIARSNDSNTYLYPDTLENLKTYYNILYMGEYGNLSYSIDKSSFSIGVEYGDASSAIDMMPYDDPQIVAALKQVGKDEAVLHISLHNTYWACNSDKMLPNPRCIFAPRMVQ
jgi:hypothetical protein